MTAIGSYDNLTNTLTVTGDGTPYPVRPGIFPNANNPNTIVAYTFDHSFAYRGGTNTDAPGSVGLGAIGIAANGVVFFNPSAGNGGNPPQGFSFVAAGNNTAVNFGEDLCGGHPEQNGQYHYHDSDFIECWNANQSMAGYNDYYGSTQYNGDNIRHPDGHSKILGFCFDGYPVYGPWGYSNPTNKNTPVTRMQSGYQIRPTEAPGRPPYTGEYPAGVFMEDWVYYGGAETLDQHNGRYCVTPEFPDGTWAYFVTTDSEGEPTFPFMVGLTSKATLDLPENSGFVPLVEEDEQTFVGTQNIIVALQPTNATAQINTNQSFTVLANIQPGQGTIHYQWQVSTDGGFSWANMTGKTQNTLTVYVLGYMTGYRYRCVLTGPVGVTQQAANSPLATNLAILNVTGVGSAIDFNAILKFDSGIGSYDMTPVFYDRDNNNPNFTTTSLRFSNTVVDFDMT